MSGTAGYSQIGCVLRKCRGCPRNKSVCEWQFLKLCGAHGSPVYKVRRDLDHEVYQCIVQGPWSVLKKYWFQDEWMSKNNGYPEPGTESIEIRRGNADDGACSVPQPGEELRILGVRRMWSRCLGQVKALLTEEALLLLGLSFSSAKWGHCCRKGVLFNLYFQVHFILHICYNKQCLHDKRLT